MLGTGLIVLACLAIGFVVGFFLGAVGRQNVRLKSEIQDLEKHTSLASLDRPGVKN